MSHYYVPRLSGMDIFSPTSVYRYMWVFNATFPATPFFLLVVMTTVTVVVMVSPFDDETSWARAGPMARFVWYVDDIVNPIGSSYFPLPVRAFYLAMWYGIG